MIWAMLEETQQVPGELVGENVSPLKLIQQSKQSCAFSAKEFADVISVLHHLMDAR